MPNIKKKQKERSYSKRVYSKKDFGNNAQRFYNSTAWRKRSRIHRNNKPMCEVCNQRPANVTDHIVPIEADANGWPTSNGGAAWRTRNHMAMCHKCHNVKRGKESHGFEVKKVKTIDGFMPVDRQEIITAIQTK